jgi:hypothetical protein
VQDESAIGMIDLYSVPGGQIGIERLHPVRRCRRYAAPHGSGGARHKAGCANFKKAGQPWLISRCRSLRSRRCVIASGFHPWLSQLFNFGQQCAAFVAVHAARVSNLLRPPKRQVRQSVADHIVDRHAICTVQRLTREHDPSW